MLGLLQRKPPSIYAPSMSDLTRQALVLRMRDAMAKVSEQAGCPLDEALELITAHAAATERSTYDIVDGVIAGSINFADSPG
jgi:hypothetical protein